MIIKNGILRTKLIFKLSILNYFLIIVNLSAQNTNVIPIINLDELEPSYEEEIEDTSTTDSLDENIFTKKEEQNIKESFATVSLLNKITANVKTIEIQLKQHYLYEEIKIYAIDCYNSQPHEKKETAVYLNVYNEISSEKIFNGWMIKSLPSVSSMEHPIYDLWVDDCYKL